GIAGISGKVKAKVAAGKAWVKGKAAGLAQKVGKTLGILKKPIRAGAESHTLSVDPKTGQFRMASVEGPVKEKIRARVTALQGRWSKKGRAPVDIDSYVKSVMTQIDRAQNTIASARANAGPAAQAELDRLAPLVIDLFIRIGATGTETKRDQPSGLGNIAPHGSQPSRHDDDVPERKLESEHIIPVRLVSTLLEQLGETRIIERGSSEDRRQHTILIYKSAATSKTRGIEGADWNFIRQLKAIAAQGVPTIEGQSITARRVKRGGAERLAAIKASFAAKRDRLKAALVEKLPALFTSRIRLTANKVKSD